MSGALRIEHQSKTMRIVLYALVGLVCLVLAAGSFLLVAAPTDAIEAQLIAAVKQRTGRDLAVAGGARLSFFPSLGVELADVTLSGPPGTGGKPFASIGRVKVAVPVWPLLRRELVVDALVLERPVIAFVTDKSGRRSWDFSLPRKAAAGVADDLAVATESADVVVAKPEQPAAAGSPLDSLARIALGDVRIVDGTITVVDERAGTRRAFSGVNLTLKLADLASPLSASGSATFNNEDLRFDLTLGSPAAALADKPTALTFRSRAPVAQATFEGTLATKPALRLDGLLELKAPSLRRLLALFDVAQPAVGGLGRFEVGGKVAITQKLAAFSGATIALDGWTATGKLDAALAGKRPAVSADLKIDALDLNEYIGDRHGADAAAQAVVADADQQRAAAEPQSGETATARPKAAAKAKPAVVANAAEWSAAPIDVSALKGFDLAGRFALGKLTFRAIVLDRATLDVSLKAGVLAATFNEIALYAGTGRGTLGIDARAGRPKVSAAFAIGGVAARGLLRDALAIDWLDGTGAVDFSLEATGRNQRELVSTLTGSARLAFRNGAIIGFNIPQMIRGLGEGKVDGWQGGESAQTDFSTLDGSFTLANGLADNQDLKLVGPLLRLTGAGKVALPQRRFDYLARPKLVASLEGQGGAADLSGVEVPVRITGPWKKPQVVPDLGAVLENPQAALDTAKKLGEKLKGAKGVEKVLKQLGDENTRKKIGEALGELLGGKAN